VKRYSFILIGLFFGLNLSAQNQLSLKQCEDLFFKNNLSLLAEQYQIDAAKALAIQAKVWDQPYLSGELNAINPTANKYFDFGAQGQKALAVQQLLYLGGKKRKEVDFAKSNIALAELSFEQLLRNLKFQIHESFFELYFSRIKATSLQGQLSNLDTLIGAYAKQADLGNVPLKDVVRLQSLSLAFKNDALGIQKTIISDEQQLKILLNLNEDIIPQISLHEVDSLMKRALIYPIEKLQEIALQKNPDYLASLKVIESNELFLAWQKSMRVPDATIGASYDQRGGAFQNQVNLTLGIPLPLWNKNKGNIKMAEAGLSKSKLDKNMQTLELNSKIESAVKTFLYQQIQFNDMVKDVENIETVYQGVLFNFQKRNISLIEFTDFMESYNQSILLMNELKFQLINSGENLKYLTNEEVL
jgi:outer membrane protein, heavy metal efflux system